ncbi:MAG: DUF488 family protein [Candidatus Paceibacterota bacterium]
MANQTVKLKRVYEEPQKSDGFRILVDRLWPRGLSKEKAKIDLWLKEIAPSNDLRKRFGHDFQKWAEFQTRYAEELREKKDLVNQLKQEISEREIVTILFAAHDEDHNNAVALKKILKI